MDPDKINRVADLIDTYGQVQAQPCGCCLELQAAAELTQSVSTVVKMEMDVDGSEVDELDSTGGGVGMDIQDVEMTKAENADGTDRTEATRAAEGLETSLLNDSRDRARPPGHTLCIYNDNAYGTNIPKADRTLVRLVINAKGQGGKCGNCLRNGTSCTWDSVCARPDLSLESPIDSAGTNGLFGQRSISSLGGGGVGGDSADRPWGEGDSEASDWVQDDESGSIVRRSRRATATPAPPVYNPDRRVLRAGSVRSVRSGSVRRAASIYSVASQSRQGSPASIASGSADAIHAGGSGSTGIRLPLSKAAERMKQNMKSALSGTMRHIRMAELASQREALGAGKGAMQELSAEYKKASRARTPTPPSSAIAGEFGDIDDGAIAVTWEENMEVVTVFDLPTKAAAVFRSRPRATLLKFPPSGVNDGPQRTEDYRIPDHFLVGCDEEDRVADGVRRDTTISLEGVRKPRGKGKGDAAKGKLPALDLERHDSDCDLDSPISAKFRKCLGCSLRCCPCVPIELRRPSAAKSLEGGALQKDYLREGCERCRACGVLCSFSLVPPIYGQWDHLVLPKGPTTEDRLTKSDLEGMADFDSDNPGVTSINKPLLTTSNKCTGCRLRNVACMALPLGEGALGGCLRCRDCNVSCSFSLGHPEVEDQHDWISRPKEVEPEPEESWNDENQVVKLTPRKGRRRRVLSAETDASSGLSSPPVTPMSSRTRSAFAKGASMTPVKGHRPPPLILALPSRGKSSRSVPLDKVADGTIAALGLETSPSKAVEARVPPDVPGAGLSDPFVGHELDFPSPTKFVPSHTRVPPPRFDLRKPSTPLLSQSPSQRFLGMKEALEVDAGVLLDIPELSPSLELSPPPPPPRRLPAPRISPVQKFFAIIREALVKIEIPTVAPDPPVARSSPSSASPAQGVTSSEGDVDLDTERVERVMAYALGFKGKNYNLRDIQCPTCLKMFSAPKEVRRHRVHPTACKGAVTGVASTLGQNPVLFAPGTTMFRCPEVGCNKAYPVMDALRWHRNFGFCPDEDAGVALARIVPCTSKGCREVFQSDEGVRQHLARGNCVIAPPPPAPPVKNGKLAAAINGVLDGMDIVLAAMTTPPGEVAQNVAIAYGGLRTSVGKLRIANDAVGGIEPLEEAIDALDTFGTGLMDSSG